MLFLSKNKASCLSTFVANGKYAFIFCCSNSFVVALSNTAVEGLTLTVGNGNRIGRISAIFISSVTQFSRKKLSASGTGQSKSGFGSSVNGLQAVSTFSDSIKTCSGRADDSDCSD
eukprot:Pompholyxophrys_punicea_v1_NODE_171_length_3020_cov_3.361092.p3 type:complete len:116 gc:universal NODE_171_length_3020_cov_3.361092:1350-1003(-)